MKKKIALALVVFGMVVFSACGAQSGTVYAKNFSAGHYYNESVPTYIPICGYDSNLKMTTCHQQLMGFHDEQRWADDCYALYWKNEEGKKGHACVASSTYESIEIGDFYEKE